MCAFVSFILHQKSKITSFDSIFRSIINKDGWIIRFDDLTNDQLYTNSKSIVNCK